MERRVYDRRTSPSPAGGFSYSRHQKSKISHHSPPIERLRIRLLMEHGATDICVEATATRTRATASYNQSMRSRSRATPAALAQPPLASNPCTPAAPVQPTPQASHARPQPRNERAQAIYNNPISHNPFEYRYLRRKNRLPPDRARPADLGSVGLRLSHFTISRRRLIFFSLRPRRQFPLLRSRGSLRPPKVADGESGRNRLSRTS